MNMSLPNNLQKLCVELGVCASDWLWDRLGPTYDEYGGINDGAQSAFEWGCQAMEALGIYIQKHERGARLFAVQIPASQTREYLSRYEFSERHLNLLLMSFCDRTVSHEGELLSAGMFSQYPLHLKSVIEELVSANLMKSESGFVWWTDSALPWLLSATCGLDLDTLPVAEIEQAEKVWDDIPEKRKRLLPCITPTTSLNMACLGLAGEEEGELASIPNSPMHQWDVIGAYSALKRNGKL